MRNLEQPRARWMKVRLGVLVSCITLGFGRLAARAHELQVRKGDELRDLAEQQYSRDVEVMPRRGTIYDRHHNALAVSVEVPSLLANPRLLRRKLGDVGAFSARLAAILSMPASEVDGKLRGDTAYRWLKHHLTPEEVRGVRETLRAFHLREGEGIDLPPEPRRWYPNRDLASHILGFVGSDGHGLEGVENALDEHLRGRSVNLRGVRDAMGRLVFAEGLTPADGQGGHDVTLTIDKTIQYIAETELGLTVRTFEARGGSIIVTDPNTGELLAMASYPTYNPNDRPVGRTDEERREEADQRRNRAVTDRFEPGSTMKIFTVGGALDHGIVNAGQLINCYGGTYQVGDLVIHDSHPETWLTPMQVLAKSSNIGAAQIGLALGADGLERVFRRFGFGERTGIPIPGEARARFGERRWYDVEVATVAFGQGIGVTNIQLAQGLGAVANGGRLVPPLLVSRISDATGALVEEYAPDAGRPAINPRIARLLAEMLTTVTEEGGTGVDASIPGVRVAGKTGTAQKAREHGRGYDDQRWTSSFIGFAPAERPALVITVVIDEPQNSHAGGAVAAPLFRRVMEQSLRYLGRLPSGSNLPRPRAQEPNARDRAETADVPRAGAIAEAGSTAPRGPNAGLAPVVVPSLRGASAREAIARLVALGLEARTVGTGTVVRQVPAEGADAPYDHVVTLELEPGGGAPAARPVAVAEPGGAPSASPAVAPSPAPASAVPSAPAAPVAPSVAPRAAHAVPPAERPAPQRRSPARSPR